MFLTFFTLRKRCSRFKVLTETERPQQKIAQTFMNQHRPAQFELTESD